MLIALEQGRSDAAPGERDRGYQRCRPAAYSMQSGSFVWANHQLQSSQCPRAQSVAQGPCRGLQRRRLAPNRRLSCENAPCHAPRPSSCRSSCRSRSQAIGRLVRISLRRHARACHVRTSRRPLPTIGRSDMPAPTATRPSEPRPSIASPDEGARSTQALPAAPSRPPSRAALLTARRPSAAGRWQPLGPLRRVRRYPDPLEHAGYAIGNTRKGWGPAELESRGRSTTPPALTSRLRRVPAAAPGRKAVLLLARQPRPAPPVRSGHRGHVSATCPARSLSPGSLSHTPEVRSGLPDDDDEVDRFASGELGPTLAGAIALAASTTTTAIATSDNGLPDPPREGDGRRWWLRFLLAIRWRRARQAWH